MEHTRYRITVRGRLSDRFVLAFDGVTAEPARGETGLLTGFIDQSQLFGLLERLRDFGFELLRLEEVRE